MHSSSLTAQRQEFCVRWNSHLGSIGAAFPQLLAGQRFVDVTLACEGSQVHCHRLVLAACSSYFESILAENPCKHPVIILPSEIKLWEIQALVDFMYKGEVNVTQAGLPQLLRCAEQLRIRGLYGSDAALNLNQLKAMTNKSSAAISSQQSSDGRVDSGGGGGGGGGGGVGIGVVGARNSYANNAHVNDNALDTDENTNNSTTTTTNTTTTNTPSVIQQHLLAQQQLQQQPIQQQLQMSSMIRVKKELIPIPHTNGTLQQHQQMALQQQQQQQQQQQLLQQQMQHEAHLAASIMTSMSSMQPGGIVSNATSNAVTEDDESCDESNSNQYEEYAAATLKQRQLQLQEQHNQQQQLQQLQLQQQQQQQQQLDSTIEDDHNYVAAHDEDDSYGGTTTGMDTELDSSANSSSLLMPSSIDTSSASYKRVRRSEASLAQAAKCVSKGQTFQTVSKMFNIPVSTIRFYMARKGILPKRKRGRGASTANPAPAMMALSALNNADAIAQSLTHLKRSDSPEAATNAAYHLMGYKQLNEQDAAI